MLPLDILAEVERIQLEAYRSIGVSETEIVQFLAEQMSKVKLSQYSNSSHTSSTGCAGSAAGFQNLSRSSFQSTRYEHPGFIGIIEDRWLRFESAREDMPPDIRDFWTDGKTAPHPILASAPTGNLNALACIDSRGGSAIIFESTLIELAFEISTIISLVICSYKGGIFTVNLKPEMVYDRVGRLSWISKELALLMFGFASRGHSLASKSLVEKLLDDPNIVSVQQDIFTGFLTFIIGHEHAHLRLNHHQLLGIGGWAADAEPNYTVLVPHALYSRATEQYLRSYQDILPPPVEAEIFKHAKEQGCEIHADALGFRDMMFTAASYAKECGISDTINFHIVGAFAFFWAMEYFERAVRLLNTGTDGRENPLFTRDYDLQSVLLRKSHPAPLSRLYSVTEVIADLFEGLHVPKSVFYDMSRVAHAVIGGSWEMRYDDLKIPARDETMVDPRWLGKYSDIPL